MPIKLGTKELKLPDIEKAFLGSKLVYIAYQIVTVRGAIAHVTDALARPAISVKCEVNPAQDLHGYDSPWPAGGGKNLLWLNNGIFKTGAFQNTTPRETTGVGTWVGISASNYLAPNSITSYTIGDNSLTVTSTANGYGVGFECKVTAGQKYTLSWVGTNAFVGISFYGSNGEYLSYVTSGVSPKTFTVPESTANAIIVLRGDGANVTGEFSNVQLEEGQTATAYSPYSNICPISGWTGANVTRTGKNLFDPTTFSSRSNYYDVNDDGSVKIKASDSSGWTSVPIISLKAGTYTISINDYTSGNYQVETSEDNYTSPTHKRYDAAFTFTLTKDGGIKVKMGTGGATLPQTVKPILNIGYTAASYSPYSGDTYSITFPAAAGTVYGGTLDVTTGKLTVNKVALTFNGSESWASVTANGHTRQRVNSVLIGIKQITGGGQTPNLISDIYPTKTPNATYAGTVGITNQQNSEDLYIMDNRYDYVDSASDYKTWLSTNNLKVAYELAEPVTYQLTPTEVTTLLGENNVWHDANGETELTYLKKGGSAA